MELKTINYDYKKFKNKKFENKFKEDIDNPGMFLILKNDICNYVGYTEVSVKKRIYTDGDKDKLKDLIKENNKIKIILFDDKNIDFNLIRAVLKCEHRIE